MKTECTDHGLTDKDLAEFSRRGELLARVLNLRRDTKNPHRWRTDWGSKTNVGLFLTVKRIVVEGE